MPGTNLWIPFQIQLDSTGSGELEVGAPALGYNWQAFCTLNPAPSGQSQTISVSGQVVASGARQSGPFAAGSGQGVTVTIAGGTASSKVAGVLQGAILPGVAAQAPLPGNGNLFEISGGIVDVTGSSVTIQAGQNGVNVSTDAPPVAGPNITIAAGQSSVTDTLHPPSNATAIGFAFEPIGSFTLNIQVQDALTLVYLEDFTFAAGGSTGRSFTIPLTPGMTESGIIVKATAGGTVVVDTTVGYTLWYIGTNSIQPVNLPTQPLYVQGPEAQAQDANSSAVFADQIVAGYYAAQVQNGSSVVDYPDVSVVGYQGSGASVQTVPQTPLSAYFQTTLAAAGAIGTIAGVSGQSIRIRKLHWLESALVGMQLLDGATAIDQLSQAINTTSPDLDYEGQKITAGNSLTFQGLGAATFIVHCLYDQY